MICKLKDRINLLKSTIQFGHQAVFGRIVGRFISDREPQERAVFMTQVQDRLAALPGVKSVTAASPFRHPNAHLKQSTRRISRSEEDHDAAKYVCERQATLARLQLADLS